MNARSSIFIAVLAGQLISAVPFVFATEFVLETQPESYFRFEAGADVALPEVALESEHLVKTDLADPYPLAGALYAENLVKGEAVAGVRSNLFTLRVSSTVFDQGAIYSAASARLEDTISIFYPVDLPAERRLRFAMLPFTGLSVTPGGGTSANVSAQLATVEPDGSFVPLFDDAWSYPSPTPEYFSFFGPVQSQQTLFLSVAIDAAARADTSLGVPFASVDFDPFEIRLTYDVVGGDESHVRMVGASGIVYQRGDITITPGGTVFLGESFSDGAGDWSSTGPGTTLIVDPENNGNSAMSLTAGSPVAISQSIDTPDSAMRLAYDVRFLSDEGTLNVFLDSVLIDSVAATSSDGFLMRRLTGDVPQLRGLTDAELTFQWDAPSGHQMYLDNISLQAVPEPQSAVLLLGGGFISALLRQSKQFRKTKHSIPLRRHRALRRPK